MLRDFCDLHTHSCYSDGTYTPRQLIEAAQDIGLSAVVLCDHNTVSGLPEFFKAAKGSDVRAIAGIEITTEYDGTELHIIAMFLRPENYEKINTLLADMLRRKEESNRALVNSLNCAGYDIEYDDIVASANGYINRAHVGAALMNKGYVGSVKEAFNTLLDPSVGYYIPPKRPDALEIVEFIRQIGAVSVLAHPFLNLDEDRLKMVLSLAKPRGLCGMETEYSKYSDDTTAAAKRIAKEFGLCESGGSDFHGDKKPDIQLGIGRGNMRVPTRFVEALENCIPH